MVFNPGPEKLLNLDYLQKLHVYILIRSFLRERFIQALKESMIQNRSSRVRVESEGAQYLDRAIYNLPSLKLGCGAFGQFHSLQHST